MECPYSGMSDYDFDGFCGEALCFVNEAMGILNHLTGYYISPEEARLNGALSAVERSLSALETFINTENDRYFLREAGSDKKEPLPKLAGQQRLHVEIEGQHDLKNQNSTTEDAGQ